MVFEAVSHTRLAPKRLVGKGGRTGAPSEQPKSSNVSKTGLIVWLVMNTLETPPRIIRALSYDLTYLVRRSKVRVQLVGLMLTGASSMTGGPSLRPGRLS